LLKPDVGDNPIGGFDALREPRRVRAIIGISGRAGSIDTKHSGHSGLESGCNPLVVGPL
jgi:oleandomycin transport system ATP-binding protein